MCRLRKFPFNEALGYLSLQVGCGAYLPVRIKSTKIHCVGESFCYWIGSVSVLEYNALQTVRVKTSIGACVVSYEAFDCFYSDFGSTVGMPQFFKNSCVSDDVNSGLPSVANSSEMPKVQNVQRRRSTRPFASSWALSIIGQLEYLSMMISKYLLL